MRKWDKVLRTSPLRKALFAMNQLETDVIEFIAAESGTRKDQVGLNSTLLGDLGIDGDDARELLESFSERFGVDVSEFEWQWHFRNEPCIKGIIYLFRKLRYRDEHLAAKKEPVTVAQIMNACEKKMWKYDV
ncbi:MAG: DUF1493 family protein [Candidatus Thiodiazotropha sp.]